MPISKFLHKLAGQRVLILGGTSGMGFAVAEGAVELGATVIVSSSSSDKVARAVDRLRSSYPDASSRISGYPCDLANAESLESNLETLFNGATSNGTHKLDHIVYTAGNPVGVGSKDITPVLIAQAQAIKVAAPLVIANKFIPRFMRLSPDSSFTLTGGVMNFKPLPGWTLPAITGGAMSGAVVGLAVDLKPLRVNGVVPGAIETELMGSISEERKDAFRSKTLVGTLGTPEDAAEAYLYLMKDRFITGSLIHTNGGVLLA
jgi:NAD(P)-dependent dehydrogenase (short-subunit alcohol dehydrogenase family)